MLKPEAMQRTLIVSSKGQQARVIETLHDLRTVHFIDFQPTRDGEFAEFGIGKPLPEGQAASERLVRLRALLRQLGLEGKDPARALSATEVEARLDQRLQEAESQVQAALTARDTARTTLQEGREMESKLQPLRSLPLRLEDYRGYDTLAVFVGRASKDLDAAIAPLRAHDHLLVKGDDAFALFVPKAHEAAFQDALFKAGYTEVEVPEGKGTPDERLREIQSQRGALETRADKATQDLERLAGEHADFLLAAEEHLSIAVEKAEAPLSFASTEHAFIVDAWVPVADVDLVEKAIERATGGNVHFQRLEVASSHGHGHHDDHAGGADAAFDAHPEHSSKHQAHVVPPTKYANGAGIGRFEWFTNLFSTPRYDEIDPTTVFAIFFPLFFGFMIGDLGLGILMVLLGFLLIKKLHRVDGMKQLGTAILVAGIVAAVFGGFVFKDALGIPLGVTHHMEDYTKEAGIADPTCYDFYKLAHEPTWGCLLGMGTAHAEPLVYKVSDIPSMLLLSVGAAFIHLLVGLLFGLRNELGHGAKHVGAKLGYLVLLLTFFPAVVALLRPDVFAGAVESAAHPAISFHLPITTAQAFMIAGAGFVLGAVVLGWAEGLPGILEIPGMFTAIMSYLRLGAVAIAKGAMAVAFNNLTLVAALTGGGVVLVLGLIGFVVAQAVLFVLGLLSGGIQALRLNFVEFFTKFYKGGGVPFRPFGRLRRSTTVGATPGGATAVALVTSPSNP